MTNNKFKSYDDGIDMSDINSMFKERDAMKIVENYSQSMNTTPTRRRPRRKRQNTAKFLLVVAGLVAAGTITINMISNINEASNKSNLSDLSRSIGSITYVKDSDFNERYDSTEISILSQNTKRNNNVAYYDHDGIAKDLLSLDDRLLDIAFTCTCNDMGENLYNKVGPNGETNVDLVIQSLKTYAEEDSYAKKDFQNINTLDEWLIKRGYTDSKGKADLNKAVKHYTEEQSIYAQIIESEKEMKEGATLK